MLIVFELYVREDFSEDDLLDAEAREAMQARVLTRREAEDQGLAGIGEPRREGAVRYLPVNARHRSWVERAIEGCAKVEAFDVLDDAG